MPGFLAATLTMAGMAVAKCRATWLQAAAFFRSL